MLHRPSTLTSKTQRPSNALHRASGSNQAEWTAQTGSCSNCSSKLVRSIRTAETVAERTDVGIGLRRTEPGNLNAEPSKPRRQDNTLRDEVYNGHLHLSGFRRPSNLKNLLEMFRSIVRVLGFEWVERAPRFPGLSEAQYHIFWFSVLDCRGMLGRQNPQNGACFPCGDVV